MTAWNDRPPITAAMLNPALVAAILATAADGYRKESDRAMPWPMAFIIVPLVLHRGTRQALPTSVRTHLATWTSRNPVLRAGFPPRAQGLVEPVKEGVRFGLTHGALTLEGNALRGRTRRPKGFQMPDELADILRRASFVGRWLAKIDNTATVFAVLGVTP
ncbi:three component ABC system middle component [Micromonospora sp. NPDC049230]|uniref:three component ABC system middle component n=1 Tax=Micromonospora sp. NPDC049230 TaxID=3155502 RepID=UPI0033E31786